MKTVMKKWGYELWIENNDLYCGKHLHVLPGKLCSAHYHKNKKETFYVIGGELRLQYSMSFDKSNWEQEIYTEIIIKKGEYCTINPMVVHRFTANTNEPCEFIEISTHHDDDDSYRIIESV